MEVLQFGNRNRLETFVFFAFSYHHDSQQALACTWQFEKQIKQCQTDTLDNDIIVYFKCIYIYIYIYEYVYIYIIRGFKGYEAEI